MSPLTSFPYHFSNPRCKNELLRRECGHLGCSGTYCTLKPELHPPLPRCQKPVLKETPLESKREPRIEKEDAIKIQSYNPGFDDGSCKKPLLTESELNMKIRKNPKYLMERVCEELLKIDRYQRGIVQSAAFLQLLRRLGAHPPRREIEDLLQYCLITRDGFIIYKPLLMLVMPDRLKRNRDQVKHHLSPPEVWSADMYEAAKPLRYGEDIILEKERKKGKLVEAIKDPLVTRIWTPDLSDSVRRIFAMWDRNLINDDKLKYHLKLLGLTIPYEAECLLSLYGPSRSLLFSKFLQALQINDITGGRKLRTLGAAIAACHLEEPPTRFSARFIAESIHEPITWRIRRGRLADDSEEIEDNRTNDETSDVPVDKRERLNCLLKKVTEGRFINGAVLKSVLDDEGIEISIEVDRLLSAIDNEVGGAFNYGKLLSAISRCPGWHESYSNSKQEGDFLPT